MFFQINLTQVLCHTKTANRHDVQLAYPKLYNSIQSILDLALGEYKVLDAVNMITVYPELHSVMDYISNLTNFDCNQRKLSSLLRSFL